MARKKRHDVDLDEQLDESPAATQAPATKRHYLEFKPRPQPVDADGNPLRWYMLLEKKQPKKLNIKPLDGDNISQQ